YGNDVKQAILPPNTTYQIDFSLPTGWLTLNPTSLYSRLYRTEEEHQNLNLNNQGGLAVNYQFLITVQNPSWAHLAPQFQAPQPLVPEGPAQLATDARGLNLPAPRPAAPMAAGAVIQSWATGLTLPWGTGFDQIGDRVWASNPAAGGGDDKDHEYEPNGTKTMRTVNATFGGSWAADLAFDPLNNKLWQVNVGGDNCIYEIDPTVPAATGQKICYGATTSERGLAYDPMTDTFFVGGWNTQTIRRFDRSGTVVASKNVGLGISGLAYNPATDHLFVMTNAAPNLVYVLDVGNDFNVLGSFGIAGFGDYSGAGLEFDCSGALWAANQTDGKMYQVESGETGTCPWAGGPPWLQLTPTSGSVGPYSSSLVDAHFIADGADRWGTYQAKIMTMHDSATPVPDVNVCFIKAFDDVPVGHWADKFIHAVAGARIAPGVGGNFRPEDPMTRGNMARWLLLGRYGNTYSPPVCQPIFADVDCDTTPNADWIVDLYNKGITAGCGTNPLRFCPDQIVTRRQMAIFLLKAKEPAGYTPPACTGTMFGDVDCS
ncbi:MAG: S-layer homology domain-containing protein, partial [Acidobacteriota bacterium]